MVALIRAKSTSHKLSLFISLALIKQSENKNGILIFYHKDLKQFRQALNTMKNNMNFLGMLLIKDFLFA